MPRARLVGETLALMLVLFAGGLLVHEAAHVMVIRALGHDGALLLRPWRLGVAGWSIYGLHAQPASPLAPAEQLLVNFAGPFLAAIPMALLLFWVRQPAPRAAVLLNVAALLFYAVIESLYVLLEDGLGVEGEWLTSAWLNYGLPFLAALLVTGRLAVRPATRSESHPR
jgi:hypothetical protein